MVSQLAAPNELRHIAASSLALRTAEINDTPFLRELYRAVRLDELHTLPWSLVEKQAFIDQQFSLQHRSYRLMFPDTEFLLIEREASPVGRFYIDRSTDAWHIVDVSILPSHQRQGIATVMLTNMQRQVTSKGESRLVLHVAHDNPSAMRLYQRLGFMRTGETPTHYRMEWSVSSDRLIDAPDEHQL